MSSGKDLSTVSLYLLFKSAALNFILILRCCPNLSAELRPDHQQLTKRGTS